MKRRASLLVALFLGLLFTVNISLAARFTVVLSVEGMT
jgi:hypothetical protein